MAESYRGLTIRIGGDTSKLTQALRAANSSIAGTDQELRKLGQALRLDPHSIEAFNAQIGYTSQKAESSAMKLYQLQSAVEQIGQSGIMLASGKMSAPIKELADATDNAHLRAEQAKASYNDVRDALAGMYNTVSEYNQKAAANLNDSIAMMPTMSIKSSESLDEFGEKLKSMVAGYGDTIKELDRPIDEVIDRLKDLHVQYFDTDSSAKKSRLRDEFDKLLETITKFEGKKISFAEGTTDLSDIDAALKALEALKDFGLDDERIKQFEAEIKRLKATYVDAMDELQQANEVARFADLNVEVTKTKASVRALASALADMKVPSELKRQFGELDEQVRTLGNSYRASMQSGKSSESAYGINDENIAAKTAAMNAFANAEGEAATAASLVKQEIDAFDRSKIDQYKDATVSANQQLLDATLLHRENVQAVKENEGALEALERKYDHLMNTASETAKVLESSGESDEEPSGAAAQAELREAERRKAIVETVREHIRVSQELVEAKRREAESENLLEYSRERKELEDLDAQYAQHIGHVDEARVAQQRLAAGEVKPHVDTTEIERLKDVQKDLETFGSSVGKAFSDVANDVRVLVPIVQGAAQNARELLDVFSENPANENAYELSMRSLAEATTGAELHAKQLREIIEGYTSDDIDEVAISTNTVGVNAERAAHQVKLAFDEIDKAKKEADDLAKRYSEALKSASGNEGGAKNEKVEELKRQLDEAEERLRGLEDAADKAMRALDTAKATEELVRYRDELAKVERKQLELAESATKAMQQKAVSDALGDTSDIDKLGTQLEEAASRAKVLREAVKLDPKNTELVTAKTRALSDVEDMAAKRAQAIQNAIDKVGTDKIDALRSKYGSVKSALDATSDAVTMYRMQLQAAEAEFDKLDDSKTDDAERELQQLVDKVESLKAALKSASAEMDVAAVASFAEDATADMARTVGSMEPKSFVDDAAFQQAMQQMAQYAQQAGQHIVDSANTIDAAYRDMRKTVNGTEDDFAAIREEAIRFSQTHITSADTLLEMEALGGQLGIAVSELREFGEVASSLDIATDIGAEDIALQMGQLSNIMSDFGHGQFRNFADTLVRLGNNMPTTESAIMSVAQRMAAVANVTSMTTPQLLSWAAAIASTGQRSESAATAINNTITGIGAAVAEGGATLEGFAKIAGMSAEQFKQAWESNSSDALEVFVKGLQALTDDSTDAIAALDAVGISGVRQRTALLALSQTIDNLNDSSEMSRDAWDGVSDQWGTAGDAAREAAQKSEGFSGALGILQNNASNLAASLGEGMIPAMKLISSALEFLTNLLDGLGEPAKNAIVTIGGISVAIGTLYPMIQQVRKGWGEMIAEMSDSPAMMTAMKGKIVEAANAIAELFGALRLIPGGMAQAVTAGEGAAGAFEALGAGAALAGGAVKSLVAAIWPLAAAMAAITAVTTIVDSFKEWKEHTDLVADATKGLNDVIKTANDSYADYTENVLNASMTAKQVAEQNEEFLKSQATFAEGMRDAFDEVGTKSAMVDAYAEKLLELGNKGKLTEGEMVQLKNAMKEYNSLTGSSISLTNDQTGELNLNAEAIRKVTEAYKDQLEQQAYLDAYNSAVKERVEAEVQVAKIEEEMAANYEKLSHVGELTFLQRRELIGSNQELAKAHEDASEMVRQRTKDEEALTRILEREGVSFSDNEDEVSGVTARIEDYGTALVAAHQDVEEFNSLTDDEKSKINEIQAALNDAGQSLTDYGRLTAAQLRQIVSNWDGTAASVKAALESIESSADKMGKPSDSEVSAFKNAQEDKVTELKRSLEDQYNAEKANYDRLEEAEKKRLSDAYDAEKRERDKQYEAAKKAFDKTLDARKKELDAEYDAAKKESDKYLKAVKDAQSAATDAFKKETDARVKEMKREYDEKKKLIDKETKADTDAIDARIAAIKGEQQAKKDAKELSEQQAKLDELVEKYNKANRESTRASIKEQIDELKSDWDEKQAERADSDLIEALEKQKDAIKDAASKRQDILKDSYDSEVERYKESRSAQLEAMQAANQAEYDRVKELEEAKLKARKEANQLAIDSLKESNDAELAAIKEANDLYLRDLKYRQDQELKEYKAKNDALLKETKRLHDDQIEDLKRVQEAELTAFKSGGQAAVDALNETKDAAAEASEEVGRGVDEVAKSANKAAQAAAAAYRDIGMSLLSDIGMGDFVGMMAGSAKSIESIFSEMGIDTQEAINELSTAMLAQGAITQEQYDAILSGVEGSTDAVMTNVGLIFAAKMGMLGDSARDAAARIPAEILAQVEPTRVAAELQAAEVEKVATTAESTAGRVAVSSEQMAGSVETSYNRAVVAAGNSATMMYNGVPPVFEQMRDRVAKASEDTAKAPAEAMDAAVPETKAKAGELGSAAAEIGGEDTRAKVKGSVNRNIVSPLIEEFGKSLDKIEEAGSMAPRALASGVAKDSDKPSRNALKVGQVVLDTLKQFQNAYGILGSNATIGFANGMVADKALTSVKNASITVGNIAQRTIASSLDIHSPSRVMRRMGVFVPQGLALGIDDGNRFVEQSMDDLSDSVMDAFDTDIDADPVQSLLESMRERERALYEQAQRMAEIVERGFDPQLTVDAAYEAIGRINAGQTRRQQQMAQPVAAGATFNIDINVTGNYLKDDVDVDALSTQIARRVRQQLSSQIG